MGRIGGAHRNPHSGDTNADRYLTFFLGSSVQPNAVRVELVISYMSKVAL
jgi:hypothetical protein